MGAGEDGNAEYGCGSSVAAALLPSLIVIVNITMCF